jgi:predicted nuclease of predicted toxin-antitoxin system
MKIKLDENLPAGLSSLLKKLGHDVETVADEGRVGQDDSAIWAAAQDEIRFLITQDMDFSNLRIFAPGSHHGILLVRLRSPSRQNLVERIGELFKNEPVDDWAGCFVVASERKHRVLRPPGKTKSR